MSLQDVSFTKSLPLLMTLTLVVTTAPAAPAPTNRPEVDRRWRAVSAGATYANTPEALVNKSFHYGLDADSVPFARSADGAKARFVRLSPDHFKLQVTNGRGFGEVEFTWLSDHSTLTRFKAAGGASLTVRTRAQTGGGPTQIGVSLQYKKLRADLRLTGGGAEDGPPPVAEKGLQALVAEVGKNRDLK